MEKIIENNKFFDTKNITWKYGLLTGLAMCFYVLFIQFSQSGNTVGWRYGMYFFLFTAITIMLYKISKITSGSIFKLGLLSGIKLSTISAMILVIANLVAYLISPYYAFVTYGLFPSSILQVVLISAILFIETFVAGNIITFINMQYFKRNSYK